MNFATTNKIKGIIILAITFIALIIATGFFGIRYADMKDELKDRESCTEHIETIERLQNELSELQNQQEGAETNNETNIKEKALFYLNTFYSADQEKNIKPLMTEEAYKKLYSTDTYRWTQITSDYKVTINNPIIYYTKISNTECDVLIFADFDVDSLSGNTSSPFIFHIEMIYEGGNWLVSDIIQNTTIQFNNY